MMSVRANSSCRCGCLSEDCMTFRAETTGQRSSVGSQAGGGGRSQTMVGCRCFHPVCAAAALSGMSHTRNPHATALLWRLPVLHTDDEATDRHPVIEPISWRKSSSPWSADKRRQARFSAESRPLAVGARRKHMMSDFRNDTRGQTVAVMTPFFLPALYGFRAS